MCNTVLWAYITDSLGTVGGKCTICIPSHLQRSLFKQLIILQHALVDKSDRVIMCTCSWMTLSEWGKFCQISVGIMQS